LGRKQLKCSNGGKKIAIKERGEQQKMVRRIEDWKSYAAGQELLR